MAGQKIDGIEVSNEVKEILKSAVEKLNSEDMILYVICSLNRNFV